MSNSTVRQEVLSALREVPLSEMNLRERLGVRLALRVRPEQVAGIILEQAQEESMVDSSITLDSVGVGFDWKELVRLLLPIFLKLLGI